MTYRQVQLVKQWEIAQIALFYTHTHASNHLLPSANMMSLMSQVVVADKLYHLYFVKQLSRVD